MMGCGHGEMVRKTGLTLCVRVDAEDFVKTIEDFGDEYRGVRAAP